MIGVIFQQGMDFFRVNIRGNSIIFSDGLKETNLGGLKLNYSGVIKEFPDLKNDDNWKHKAIERFKEKIKSFKTEEEKADYIIRDLKKFGFIPKYKQKQGHRIEVIK